MRHLASGEWGPGDPIPSESELASRFGVSQGTVRKAIDEMAAENLLVRQQGKGTFVATHKDPGSYFRFLRLGPNDDERRARAFLWNAGGRRPAPMLREHSPSSPARRSSFCDGC